MRYQRTPKEMTDRCALCGRFKNTPPFHACRECEVIACCQRHGWEGYKK